MMSAFLKSRIVVGYFSNICIVCFTISSMPSLLLYYSATIFYFKHTFLLLLSLWGFGNIQAVMIAEIFSWGCCFCWDMEFTRPVSWLGNPDGVWAEIFWFAYATGNFCSHGGVFLHFASSWDRSEPNWTVHDDLLSSLNFPKVICLLCLHLENFTRFYRALRLSSWML